MKIQKPGNCFLLLLATAFATLLCASIARADGNDVRSAVVAGQKAPAFQATTMDGKTVQFPNAYKGKVVLLDFWATWCPPCRKELPLVVAAYQRYHTNGFEVLSVTLDKADHGPALMQFVRDKNMTWPQIYDGGYWKAAVAVKYGVRAIPCPVLVDGDSGLILAQGPQALGSDLIKHLRSALAAKAKNKTLRP